MGFLLRQAYQAMRSAMDRELRTLGITASQYSLLSVLGNYPGLTITELGLNSMLTQQTTSEVVRVLLREDLITASPDPADRRARRLALSARGESVLREADACVARLEDDALVALSARERGRVMRWLVECAQHYSA
jgi:DNA-binding MarR family transcriptional regulator